MEPAPLVSGPINGLTDEERADTTGPSLAQSTTGESLEATAASAFRSASEVWRNPAALNAEVAAPSNPEDAYQYGDIIPLNGAGPTSPPLTRMSAADANAANKAAGGTLTPFSHDTTQEAFNGMLSDNLANQKDADVISRSAAGIIASPARVATGMLVSLADPRNLAAMMLPGVGEATVAEALGGGTLGRVAGGAVVGATQNFAAGLALAPLQYAQASTDHEDFSWGDTLRNAAFMAAFGAGGGALHGLLTRAGPDTTEAVMKAALARVVTDDPRGVDTQAILDHGELAAREPTGPEAALAELDARQAPDTDYRDMLSTSTKRELAPGETWRDRAVSYVDSTRPDPAVAAQSATDMADRALAPTDPELAPAQRVAATAAETAPVLEGVADKDAAEVAQMVADHKALYDGMVQGGQITEHPSLAEAGQDELAMGKAHAAYAAVCNFGGA